MKLKIIYLALALVLVFSLAAVIAPANPVSAQTVCLDVDGEGLADGAPIPGWNLVFGGPPPIATVTATSNPIGIHSGNRGVRVNGDYEAGKEFDIVAKGVVTVDYWHYPKPGTSTNSVLGLHGGNYPSHWRYLNVWKNDQDLWWIASDEVPHPSVASYSGKYTHIVITIDTSTGLFDLYIDEQLVYQGTVTNADKIEASGIRYVSVHSGRGGSGTDSYFDDILITATETAPPPTVIFSDDFEYDDSLENHGWTIETSNPQGDPQTATDPENAGNRVAYIESRAQDYGVFPAFYRSFSELPLQPGMEISIRFYDTGDSCGNCDVHTWVYFDNSSDYVVIGWYNSPSSFTYYYEISGSWSGELHEPYGLRGIGWHTFTWRVEQNGGIDLLIDGNLILDDLTGVTTLSEFRVGTGSDPYTYSFSVDDFLVTSHITASGTEECVATATGTGMACFTTSHGTIEDLEALSPITPAHRGVTFPHGMFNFKVTGLTPEQTVTITIELPGPIPVGTVWWKYVDATWYSLPIGDDDGDNIITITLTEGVFPGDTDTIAGQITDPGGPGSPMAASTIGWESYPVNKLHVLLPRIALVAAIIAGVSLLVLRRRGRGPEYS